MNINLLVVFVSEEFGVSVEDLMSAKRTSDVTKARYALYYSLREVGYTNTEIARHFNKNHTSIGDGMASHWKLYGNNQIYTKMADICRAKAFQLI